MRTRRVGRRTRNLIRMVPILLLCLFMDVNSGTGYGQNGGRITKQNLVAALKDCNNRRRCARCRRCKLKASDFIRQIEQLKVDFTVRETDEREIREAGSFLSENEIDELIAAVRNAFVVYSPHANDETPGNLGSLDEISKSMNMTLIDSYGDQVVDGKLRLIHSSISSSLRLDSSYKIYESNNGPSVTIFGYMQADKNHPDGTVFIGKEFIKHLLISDAKNTITNDSRLYFTVAHVMSHFKQNKVGETAGFTEVQRELHANFLAGWCVARFLRNTKNDSPEYRESFFNVMDIAFHYGEPAERYGTAKERLDAASAGFGLQAETDPDKVYRKGIEYVGRL